MMTKKELFFSFKNNQGQALIEFLLFLPFMLMMFVVVNNFAEAINSSINQQKATRSYFYLKIQNSPQIVRPSRDDGGVPTFLTWTSFGHFFIGWADYLNTNSPVAPCYKLNLPLEPDPSDRCENRYNKLTTQFIRVGTAYGACGGTYQNFATDGIAEAPGSVENLSTVLDSSSCDIKVQ
jgi:hypothetical protein